ncbi:MAG TPA: bifunctional nuclease family protein [Bacteroidia bacterium]|nr:bifunctional nuclease family protein [Bacteroidia bacterium]HRD39364.1 bifunctional nuclease family protein [Bacteroidia bacterium]
MKKVRLEIVGLSYSQTQSGAYALVLGESAGTRRLPIIIGGFEAQAIAIELEKMTPSRPLTHDLFKTFAETFDVQVNEVLIYNLVEGIFYAKLICNDGTKDVEIDARTSDAIALAVRFACPIYTYEFILKSAGIVLDDENAGIAGNIEAEVPQKEVSGDSEDLKSKSTEELKNLLQTALDDEQYETASKIRDELNVRKKS